MRLIQLLYSDINHSEPSGLFGKEKLSDNHKDAHDQDEPPKAFFQGAGAYFIRKVTADKKTGSGKYRKGKQQDPVVREMIQGEEKPKQGINSNDQ